MAIKVWIWKASFFRGASVSDDGLLIVSISSRHTHFVDSWLAVLFHLFIMLTVSSNDRRFILAGAGLSAESGPTFRGVGGLWRNYRIEEVASPAAWHRDLRLVWEFYSMRRRVASAAKPNPAHFALATLENSLPDRLFVCTQNVDNLHEQGGSRKFVHMHGELFKSRCDSCSRAPFDATNLYDPPAEVPRCECGGRIRPHICWFGERKSQRGV